MWAWLFFSPSFFPFALEPARASSSPGKRKKRKNSFLASVQVKRDFSNFKHFSGVHFAERLAELRFSVVPKIPFPGDKRHQRQPLACPLQSVREKSRFEKFCKKRLGGSFFRELALLLVWGLVGTFLRSAPPPHN